MTSWGNYRQRASALAALITFCIMIILATGGHQYGSLFAMFVASIFAVGAWSLGLPRAVAEEWDPQDS